MSVDLVDDMAWYPCPVCRQPWDPTRTEQVFIGGRWFDRVWCWRVWKRLHPDE